MTKITHEQAREVLIEAAAAARKEYNGRHRLIDSPWEAADSLTQDIWKAVVLRAFEVMNAGGKKLADQEEAT